MDNTVIRKSLFSVIIALLLVAIFCSNSPIMEYLNVKNTVARAGLTTTEEVNTEISEEKLVETLNIGIANAPVSNVKTYIKDLKMASSDYSYGTQGASEAKQRLRNAGYVVIEHDMNEGTGEGYVYLGYKTTTDKAEAITDISIMDMKGGYRAMDYNQVSIEKGENITALVKEMKTMLNEFIDNYKLKSVGAVIGYAGLNKVDYIKSDKTRVQMGDVLLNYNDYGDEFLRDMLLKGNSSIVSGIYNYLTLGIQNPTHVVNSDDTTTINTGVKSWLGKIVPEELVGDWTKYEDKANEILPILKEFAEACIRAEDMFINNDGKAPEADKTHDEILKTFEESDMKGAIENDSASVYYTAYQTLKTYSYGKGTLADLFVPRDVGGMMEEMTPGSIYPLLKTLTDGQYASIHTGNLISMIADATIINDKTDDNGRNGYQAAMAELDKTTLVDKAGTKIDLYYGVNLEAYEGEIGVTDAAYRQMSAENKYDALIRNSTDREDLNEKTFMWAGVVSSVILVVTGAFSFISIIAGVFPTLFAKCAVASAVAGFAKLAAASMVTSMLNWLCLAVVVIIVVYYLIEWIRGLVKYNHPTYTAIPPVMFDIVGINYISYNVVTDLTTGREGDLNCFDGLEWNALYYTTDKQAGDPLMLNNSASGSNAVFNVVKGNGTTQRGYEPVTRFGEKSAFNTNAHAYSDTGRGIFLHYLVDGTLSVDKVVQEGKYLGGVLLRTEKTEEAAKKYLTEKGYSILNFNLSAGIDERATYIGYKTTNISGQALTDLRIAYGTNAANMIFGTSSYGACGYSGLDVGKSADGKSDNMIGPEEYALYATVDKTRGSPIYAKMQVRGDFNTPILGDEPINLFSGGGAFNFAVSGKGINSAKYIAPSYVYFTPSIKYTSGEEYLGGIYILDDPLMNRINRENDYGKKDFTSKYMGTVLDATFYSSSSWARPNFTMRYTKTFNPKRAISDIVIFKQSVPDPAMSTNALPLPDSIQNHGMGYMAVEIITRQQEMFYGKYTTSSNLNKIFKGKAFYLTPASDTMAPLKMSEVNFSTSKTTPKGYRSVSNFDDYYGITPQSINNYEIYTYSTSVPLFIYIKRPAPVKPKYISNIIPAYSDMDDYSWDMARATSMAGGAESFVNYNLNREEEDYRTGILGLAYTKTKTDAIRDIALYYVKGTAPTDGNFEGTKGHNVPEKVIKSNGVEYKRASTNGIYIGRSYYVYFYVTYSSILGEPITSVSFSQSMMGGVSMSYYLGSNSMSNDEETARVLSTGYNSIQGMFYMKIFRSAPQKYIANLKAFYAAGEYNFDIYNKATHNYFGEAWVDEEDHFKLRMQQNGVTNFLYDDLNWNTMGTKSRPSDLYLGYTRTNSKATAITDIVAVSPSTEFGGRWSYEWYRLLREMINEQTMVINGITYNLVGDVNENGNFTWIYTTTDSRAGSPITSLSTFHLPRVSNPWNVVKYSKSSRMSANGGSADINAESAPKWGKNNEKYLIFTREDGSVGTGNNANTASVFSDSTAVMLICLAIVMAGGLVAFAVYGKRRKEKKLLSK